VYFLFRLTYKLHISVDIIVEIQVTKLLTWNVSQSVTGVRYFLG